MLVVVGVLALLLGIMAPALASVVRLSGRTACQARLHDIGRVYALYASDNRGEWPTMPRDDCGDGPVAIDAWGDNGHFAHPIDEIVLWAHPLRGYLPDDAPGTAVVSFSCPTYLSRAVDRNPRILALPGAASWNSYVHSPALFTRASAWTASNAPVEVNSAYRVVRLDQVTAPSRKVNLIEPMGHHHGDPVALLEPSRQRYNLLAADAHVEARRVGEAMPGVAMTGQNDELPSHWLGRRIPFLTSLRGAAGADW